MLFHDCSITNGQWWLIKIPPAKTFWRMANNRMVVVRVPSPSYCSSTPFRSSRVCYDFDIQQYTEVACKRQTGPSVIVRLGQTEQTLSSPELCHLKLCSVLDRCPAQPHPRLTYCYLVSAQNGGPCSLIRSLAKCPKCPVPLDRLPVQPWQAQEHEPGWNG